jgi:hypothetical protein
LSEDLNNQIMNEQARANNQGQTLVGQQSHDSHYFENDISANVTRGKSDEKK